MHTAPRDRRRRRLVVAAMCLVAIVGVVIGLVATSSHAGSSQTVGSPSTQDPTTLPPPRTSATTPTTVAETTVPRATTTAPPRTTTTSTTVVQPVGSVLSSCQSVVHIGDSTSESLVSPSYLPNPAERLSARYAQVGAVNQDFLISGARSIVETWEGQPNAYTVASQLASTHYVGCWVVDMGVNDTADIAVGSRITAPQRIERMMSVIGNQPVLWVAIKSLVASGAYSEANMQSWDDALVQACSAHPNMKVFNWAAQAQPSYYINDGIHYNSPGSAILAGALAKGLAAAFPRAGASSHGCLVN
jgi:hypothetical protein